MQTPKTRNIPSGGPQRTSPRSTSSEAFQKNSSPRAATSEGSIKSSPGVKSQLKPTARYVDHTASSSNLTSKAPKERSPKVADHKSPRSPVSESKHPGKVSELEFQLCQLENDLKSVKDQLSFTEALKDEAWKAGEESNKQLLALSEKLEDSQNQLLDQSATEEVHKLVLREALEGHDLALKYELETIQKQYSHYLSALASALKEIKQLKFQLEIVSGSEASQAKHSDSTRKDFDALKENLGEAQLLVEDMKKQLKECKDSETQAQMRVVETLTELEIAKMMVETLSSDGHKTTEAYEDVASELGQSKARVKLLEELVSKLKVDICNRDSQTQKKYSESEIARTRKTGEESIEAEFASVKVEAEQLRSALEAANTRYNEVQAQNTEKMRKTIEMLEHIKSTSIQREAELEEALRKSKFEIEELKANLIDKETELQGISEENEGLTLKLEKMLSGMRENELESELEKSKADVESLKSRIVEKEEEWLSASGGNETLRMEIKDVNHCKASDEVVSDLESAGAAEKGALMKIAYMMEEVDKSNRRAARMAEQLEAAQTANADMETELRRLKVQLDQWRKAAEAATAMLSAGNNNGHFMERTGSMDSNCSPGMGIINSPYAGDISEDTLKKKNANVLRRFGVLWKKQQK
ncbi:interactor of constitutive active ROPs 3-like [Primulina huaijiensis]|uniref:interactor of constitutive active ROPs 3-like n=1 Tax=Primulina huaijiensis TaxID=1492673 RepID=UPI003CC6E9EE